MILNTGETNITADECLTTQAIHLFAAGGLDKPQFANAKTHLRSCSSCRTRLVQTLSTANTLPIAEADSAVVAPASEPNAFEQDTTLPFSEAARATPGTWRDIEPWITDCRPEDGIGTLGEFQLKRMLGRGGMGIVFLAFDTGLNREVAIKVLTPSLLADPVARDRFRREAQAAAGVRHPGIVTIYQVVDDGDLPFIVMEYIEGESLAARLGSHGPLPIADAKAISIQVSDALAAAHSKGLVHRDIKPANILIDSTTGDARLTDFGLVRGNDDVTLTATGSLIGTPAYMAPEVISDGDLDSRMDLFSLGATIYHMVTGRIPFPGKTAIATLHKISSGKFVPVAEYRPDCPQSLANTIHKLLSPAPADRYQTADAVISALNCSETSPAAKTSVVASRPKRSSRIPRLVAWVSAILLLCIAATIAFTGFRSNNFVCKDAEGQLVENVTPQTIADAIAATPDGGSILVDGAADIYLNETLTIEKSLDIEGTGDHPTRIVGTDELEGPLFELNASVRLANLHLENTQKGGINRGTAGLLEINGDDTVLHQCTLFTEGDIAIQLNEVIGFDCIDTKISNPDGIALSWQPPSAPATILIAENKIVARNGIQITDRFAGKLSIFDSRILVEEMIGWSCESTDDSAVEVHLGGTVILALESVLTLDCDAVSSVEDVIASLRLTSQQNVLGADALAAFFMDEHETVVKGLAEWTELPSVSDTQSKLVDLKEIQAAVGADLEAIISSVNTSPETADRAFDRAKALAGSDE